MGEVHADDVQTSLAEHVDLLWRVGLWANGADDGGTAELLLWHVLGVELREPLDSGTTTSQVSESVSHCDG